MAYGAGYVAARKFGAKEIVDPRPFAVKSIPATYLKYPKTGPVSSDGLRRSADERSRRNDQQSDVDMVMVGTPIILTRVIEITKPYRRVRYELQEIGQPAFQVFAQIWEEIVSSSDCRF